MLPSQLYPWSKVEGESLLYNESQEAVGIFRILTDFSGVCYACGSQPLCLSMKAVPGLALVY